MKLPRPRLKPLMEGLYYPAVLGAGFFSVLARVVLQQGQLLRDVSFWLAVVLVLFFSASYMATHAVPEDAYTLLLFTSDLAEISGLTVAFAALGFADLAEPREIHLVRCYGALLFVVAVDTVWPYLAHSPGPYHWGRRVLAGSALLVGMLLGPRYLYVDCVVVAVLALVAGHYILTFERRPV